MKIYLTRHGQVAVTQFVDNVQYPVGDMPLSPLGREQAAYLGAYMKHLGFKGKIYASPYRRALETAQVIAEHTGSLIVPWAPMREVVRSVKNMMEFTGLTLEQIKEEYPNIDPEAKLTYPWWTAQLEETDDVTARVRAGLDALNPQEDIMLVGHGASVYCGCEALQIPHKGGDGYNCSFSMYDSEDKTNFKWLDGAHMPYEKLTFNTIVQADEDRKLVEAFMAEGVQIPEEVKKATTGKVLHISDTRSSLYPYIQKLIEEIQPNIIIHTGDFVDEVKAGRMFNTEAEYTQGVRRMAKILKNSGAEKIYAVPGNNDIEDVLRRELDFAEVVPTNTVVGICGISCALGHICYETTAPAQWSFYGHGTTGETWSPEKNDLQHGTCRFNICWGISVFLLPERKQFCFPSPKIYHWGKI